MTHLKLYPYQEGTANEALQINILYKDNLPYNKTLHKTSHNNLYIDT